MTDFLGFFLSLFSLLAAGMVSGLRLKPSIDAGEQFTPRTFALYPALLAFVSAFPIVVFLYWRRRQIFVTIGSIKFTDKQLFALLWSILYIFIALTFFPSQPTDQQPSVPPLHQATI